MSRRTLQVTDAVYEYLVHATLREPPILAKLREETAKMPNADLQIAPEQGQLMALLVELVGARRAIELGVFTGYSSLAVALALPDDGHLFACDVSEQYTRVARRYWKEAGVEHKIQLELAPALQTLAGLVQGGHKGTLDFAFIDADKTAYDAYYERCLELLRPGGLIVIDNVLRHGDVADRGQDDDGLRVIRALNEKIRGDDRVTMSLLPVADGLMLARKR
jgi:predicted O-methyltransferase YrrM